jgi:hypothetical protein
MPVTAMPPTRRIPRSTESASPRQRYVDMTEIRRQTEIRRHDTYCSNSSCSPSTRFAGLGPGDRRAIGRPSKRSSPVTNSAVPSGRPLPSDRRSAAKSSARSCKSRSAKHDVRSSTGRTITRLSSTPARWARALDQGQSSARDTRRARTGFCGLCGDSIPIAAQNRRQAQNR